MKRFNDNAIATRLINEAQQFAVNQMLGQRLVASDLPVFAARVRMAILRQAALGQWREIGIVDPDDLAPLEVTARAGNTLLGEPPIKVEYDFARTRLAGLLVDVGAAQ